MHTSYVLIDNLAAEEEELRFEHFRLRRIQTPGDLNDAGKLFGRMAYLGGWIYERKYPLIPELHLGQYGSIPWHVDDALLCFRLFKVGDIAFVAQVIKGPNDEIAPRYPHRIMAAVSTNIPYHFTQAECREWDTLSEGLPSCVGWYSQWFKIARAYFLYGGSKEFNIRLLPRDAHGSPVPYANGLPEIDRVLDYFVALEATLVPERDVYIGRRLRKRASALLNLDPERSREAERILTDCYDVRSTIAHGRVVDTQKLASLQTRMPQFEGLVRKILRAALCRLPFGDEERKQQLAEWADVTDEDRVDEMLKIARSISDESRRERLLGELSGPAK